VTGSRSRHAVLMPDLGPLGEPFLPAVGQVFWVSSLLYSSSDPAPGRPAVVLLVPAVVSPTARIQIVTRTHDTAVAGVQHGAELFPTLDLPGVFSQLTSCLVSSWRPGNVLRAGSLSASVFAQVEERFS